MRRSAARRRRGFTLVELMMVVAIVGVISALAYVGYAKYMRSAKLNEPIYVVQSIRAAQESYRAETMSYLDVSPTDAYHPRNSGFNSTKFDWRYATADLARWQTLGVVTDSAVRFGYKCRAGNAGAAVSYTINFSAPPTWPTSPSEPWYIVEAQGDPDDKSKIVRMLAHSFNNEIAWENE
jgi:type IV pilus assembly protein PilA